jgi:hypothetical protein
VTTPAEGQGGVAPVPLPPVAPGDVPADNLGLWGAERDSTQNFGPDHDNASAIPSIADSPHWTEIQA